MRKNTILFGMAAIALTLGSCGSNASEASGADSVAETRRNYLSYMENLRFK